MISAATLAAALAGALGVHPALAADQLYRWLEPDGSRTFSPTPPTDGTPYTAVDPDTLRPLGGETNARAPAPRAVSARTPASDPARRPRAPEPARASRPAATPTRVAAPLRSGSSESARCAELRKRVVSLERRLTVPLTAEEMDETVVRMAGYQRSFESLCL